MKDRTMQLDQTKTSEGAIDTGIGQSPRREWLGRRELVMDSLLKGTLIAIVSALALIYLLPMYWLFVTSIKFPDSLYELTPRFIPRSAELSFLAADLCPSTHWPVVYQQHDRFCGRHLRCRCG